MWGWPSAWFAMTWCVMTREAPARPFMPQASPGKAVAAVVADLQAIRTRRWTLMEVCGGQTHSIVRWGLDQLLAGAVELVHGPGCPVCVTPAHTIDQALALAMHRGVVLCSFGDMLKVPGSHRGSGDLLQVRATGGDVRVITRPSQALELARAHPERQVVLLAVGFETTAPAIALLAEQVRVLGLSNLSLLLAQARVVPAMAAIAAAPERRVQGFLAAGHVAAVMGQGELEQLALQRQIPVVITGFAPLELLQGVLACVRLLEAGTPRLHNAYAQVVRQRGNPAAQALLRQVFSVADGPWRGLGTVAAGVLQLRPSYRHLDARLRFGLGAGGAGACGEAEPRCRADQVLQGVLRPTACPSFGVACTPHHPLGAPMVSAEGACAAYLQRSSRHG